MSNAVSGLWGAAKSGLSSLGSGLGNVVNGIGSGLGSFAHGVGDFLGMDGQFGLSGPTGQAMPGGASSSSNLLSQSVPSISSYAGGGTSGAPLSASSFGGGGPIADVGGIDGALDSMGVNSGGPFDISSVVSNGLAKAGGATGATGVAPAQGGFLSRILGQGGRNILPIGMLINSAIHANDEPAGVAQLRALADNAAGQGALLTRTGTEALNGNLPGPAMSAIQQALRASQAGVRSNYAGLGLTGSSMEQQDLNAASERALAQRFSIGQQMAQTGLNAATNNNYQAAQLYSQIMNALTSRDTQFGNALARFAGAVTL